METSNTPRILESPVSRWVALILAGVIVPFFVLVAVEYTGASVLIEEVVKAIIIGAVVLGAPVSGPHKYAAALVFGAMFGVSETVLYNAAAVIDNGGAVPVARLLVTVPMHAVTAAVIISGPIIGKRYWYLVAGFLAAFILHIAFNAYIAPLFV